MEYSEPERHISPSHTIGSQHQSKKKNYEEDGDVRVVSLTIVGPYSKLRPQFNAVLSKFWMPETSAAISLFH